MPIICFILINILTLNDRCIKHSIAKRLKTEDTQDTTLSKHLECCKKKPLFSSQCLQIRHNYYKKKKNSQFYKEIFDSFTYVRPKQWRLIIVVLILVLVLLHLLFLLPPLLLQNHLLVFLWGYAKHSDPIMTKHYN